MLKPEREVWIDHSVPLLTLRGNTNILLRGTVFVGYEDGSVTALLDDQSDLDPSIVSLEAARSWALGRYRYQMVLVASDDCFQLRIVLFPWLRFSRLLWFKRFRPQRGASRPHQRPW
jgi:hypothetical protein